MDSLSKLLESKDLDGVLMHFSSLIRDLTSEGMTQEVSVVTGWLMEVQQIFANDKAGMLVYITQYLRRYRGRGFPVRFDLTLYAKALAMVKSTGGLTDDQKDDVKKIKSLIIKVETLTNKVGNQNGEITALKT